MRSRPAPTSIAYIISYIRQIIWVTYMNRPETLLHVVGGEKVGYASKFVEEVVFETEHGGWSDDGRLGVDVAYDFLAPSLFLLVLLLLHHIETTPTLVEKYSETESLAAL